MRLRILRWATVSLPVLFFICLELVEDFVLEPNLGRWIAHLVAFILVGVSATTLSFIVFGAFARIEKSLVRQNKDLAVLNDVSYFISGNFVLDELLSRALEKVLEITESDVGEIFLIDETTQDLVWKVHKGLFPEAFGEVTAIKIGESIPGLVAQSQHEIVISNLQTDTRFKRRAVTALGFQSFASIPLRANDRVVGVLNVADRRKLYQENDTRLLTAIGNQIGLAIESARLYTQVEEARGYLHGVIESSGDAIITTDLNGHVRSWNLAAEQIYGWKNDEVLGRYIPMIPDHLREEVTSILDRLRTGETVRNLETERLHKTGRLVSVVVTASPVRDAQGALIGLVGISKDISENKELQAEITRQRQSVAVLEERDRIAREMHDGLAQVLGYVNIKAQAAHRFLQIGKLEDAETQLMELKDAAQDVYADVREAILGLKSPISQDKGLKTALEDYLLNYERQTGISSKLKISAPELFDTFKLPIEIQLIRVIQEALTNVRKHSEARCVSVQFDRINNYARITIEDDGRGFNVDQPHHSIWPRFGLQTMRDRIESVSGVLTIHSTPGGGARICVTLPLTINEDLYE